MKKKKVNIKDSILNINLETQTAKTFWIFLPQKEALKPGQQ